ERRDEDLRANGWRCVERCRVVERRPTSFDSVAHRIQSSARVRAQAADVAGRQLWPRAASGRVAERAGFPFELPVDLGTLGAPLAQPVVEFVVHPPLQHRFALGQPRLAGEQRLAFVAKRPAVVLNLAAFLLERSDLAVDASKMLGEL